MTEQFYPSVDDPRHESLTEKIQEICREYSAQCIDMVRYYELPEKDADFLKTDFSHEALWIRTLPDLFISPLNPPPFFLDVKTKANPKYQNVAVELSSFYWSLRRNIQDFSGINCGHLYATRDLQAKIRVFSPLLVKVKKTIISKHHWFKHSHLPWEQETIELFRRYATCTNSIIDERDRTSGSGDPFVLIPQTRLEKHPILSDFLCNQQMRVEYLSRKRILATSLQRFQNV